jgi:hypothetical protein
MVACSCPGTLVQFSKEKTYFTPLNNSPCLFDTRNKIMTGITPPNNLCQCNIAPIKLWYLFFGIEVEFEAQILHGTRWHKMILKIY